MAACEYCGVSDVNGSVDHDFHASHCPREHGYVPRELIGQEEIALARGAGADVQLFAIAPRGPSMAWIRDRKKELC